MRARFSVILLLILAVAVPALAEKFWESKDFTEWTEKECMEMLRKSPWAFSNTFGRVQSVMINSSTGVEDSGTTTPRGQSGASQPTWGEGERQDVIEFQVLTAKPIRMALSRLQMIRKPGDAALKEQAMKFVEQTHDKAIVIQISYRTIPPGSQAVSDIHSFFLTATLADFRNDTQLISDKNRIVPIGEYWAPNQARSNPAFVFPRIDSSGEPSFTGSEKTITLKSKFAPAIRGKKQTYDIFVRMNPKEMRFKNQFAF